LEDVIRAQIEELKMNADIDLFTVSMGVKEDLLWSRIQDRLRRCPERVKYNEHSYEWMQETLRFYNNFKWDMTLENNDGHIDSVKRELLARVAPHLSEIVAAGQRKQRATGGFVMQQDDDEMFMMDKENVAPLGGAISPVK
jgi:hypothetical protein